MLLCYINRTVCFQNKNNQPIEEDRVSASFHPSPEEHAQTTGQSHLCFQSWVTTAFSKDPRKLGRHRCIRACLLC